MRYCSKCGNKVKENDKFCIKCGCKNENDEQEKVEFQEEIIEENEFVERKTVYEGKIHKCPNCGEVLKSFIANCPACGYELNEKKVSISLQKFINEIDECEKKIADNTQNYNQGWASWDTSKRVLWIIFNVFFFCIPLVIYFCMPLILIKTTPKLSKEEKEMQSLIENFPFPNDRKSIIEALIFSKEKIDFISNKNINRKNAYWMRLWCSKAEQLKQKADMLFPNDNIVKKAYEEIIIDKSKINKQIKMKTIIGIAILVIVIVFFVVRSGIFENTNIIDTTDYNATFEWQENGLFKKLPEPPNNNGKIISETDKNINIEIYKIKINDFDTYVKKCRESGFDIDVVKNDSVFYSKNYEGYDLNIFYDSKKEIMDIHLDAYDVKDNKFEINTYESYNIGNYSINIPNYWEEEGSKEDYRQFYGEKGNKVTMLSISYPKETDDDYDVSFEGLKSDNENMKKTVANMFTDGTVYDDEEFESDYGVKGILYKFNFKQKTGILSKTEGEGILFCFPSPKDRRWFNVTIIKTINIEDKKYEDDYMKIIASIKEN